MTDHRWVRTVDPQTSVDAAAGVTDQGWTDLQSTILNLLREGPLTDEELIPKVWRVGPYRTPQRIRTARKELTLRGVLRASNVTRIGRSGYRATVWEVAS